MALLRAASIRGVPALGLPKISSLLQRIFIPTFSVSPLWSTSANSVTPWLQNILEYLHGLLDVYGPIAFSMRGSGSSHMTATIT